MTVMRKVHVAIRFDVCKAQEAVVFVCTDPTAGPVQT